jgi:hypothetical protein
MHPVIRNSASNADHCQIRDMVGICDEPNHHPSLIIGQKLVDVVPEGASGVRFAGFERQHPNPCDLGLADYALPPAPTDHPTGESGDSGRSWDYP